MRLFERERSARRLSQQLARIGTFLVTELDPSPRRRGGGGGGAGAARHRRGRDQAGRGRRAGRPRGERGGGGGASGHSFPARLRPRRRGRPVPQRRFAFPTSAFRYAVGSRSARGRRTALVSRRAAERRRGWPAGHPLRLLARRKRLARRRGRSAGRPGRERVDGAFHRRAVPARGVEKERSETILAHVADGIVAVDRDGKVVLWNEAATRASRASNVGDVLGRDPAEVLKRSARRSGERGRRNAHPRHPARRRGGVALAERGGDARSDRRDLRADLHLPRRLLPASRRADEVRDSSPPSRTSCARRSLPSTASPRPCSVTTSTSATRSGARSSSTSSSESERLTAIVDTLLNVARLEAGRPARRARADRPARARDGRGGERRPGGDERPRVRRSSCPTSRSRRRRTTRSCARC